MNLSEAVTKVLLHSSFRNFDKEYFVKNNDKVWEDFAHVCISLKYIQKFKLVLYLKGTASFDIFAGKYDLDTYPVCTKAWTELENVRLYYEFFKGHEGEF